MAFDINSRDENIVFEIDNDFSESKIASMTEIKNKNASFIDN